MSEKSKIGAAIKEIAVLVQTQQAPNDSVDINEQIGGLAIQLARALKEPPAEEIGD